MSNLLFIIITTYPLLGHLGLGEGAGADDWLSFFCQCLSIYFKKKLAQLSSEPTRLGH